MTFEEVKTLVEEWGVSKNIVKKTDSQVEAQFTKVEEELEELHTAFRTLCELRYGKLEPENDAAYAKLEETFFNDFKLELGDLLVTIIMVAANAEVDLTQCLEMAYNKIRNRQGKTIDGIFVKDAH